MMERGKISDNFSSLTENVEDYINLRINYIKLVLTEKIAKLASFFMIAVIFFILAMFLLLFISLAFVFWFGEEVGPTYLGALIVVALYIIVGVGVYLGRFKLFLNPLVTHLTRVLMEEEEEQDD
jgi:ABC-type proline/glycine betaine transport system permease subunit